MADEGWKPVVGAPDMTKLGYPSGYHETAQGYPYIQAGETGAPDAQGWKPVKGPPEPMSGPTQDAIATNGTFSKVLDAFGQGFKDQWGAPNYGTELRAELDKADLSGETTVPKAFNEAFLRPAANAIDLSLRSMAGVYQGIHDASIAAGHPFDAAAAGMEAFPLFGAELGRLGWYPHLEKPTVAAPPDLEAASGLSVIGAEKKSISEGTPAEAANEAMPQNLSGAVTPYEEKMLAPAGSPFEQSDWQKRFDQYVAKLQTSEDAKNLIQNSVDLNNTFEEARGGEIPAAHLGALSDATGIPVEEMNVGKLRTRLDGPEKFRAATQLMLKLNDDVYEAARAHRAQPSFESRKSLVEAIIKHDAAVEYVMGLRAEWGKTGNAMQEFLERSKDSQGLGKYLADKKGPGWNSEKLDEIADQLGSLNSREGAARYLQDLRKPGVLDKLIWYWTNGLLSGPITHGKYVLANSAYLAHDTLIATPLAGVSGAVRQAFSKEQIDRVYMGEAVAKAYGLVAGVPDALYAAAKAVKTNMPTPLEAQVKGAGQTNPVTQLKPNPFTSAVGKPFGEVIGAPSRVISGIHTFFNFLGYRSELEALSYRRAVKDGYKPTDPEFWKVQKEHVYYPDDPMMDAAIEAGARANFVQELGPSGKAMQGFLYKTKIGRFLMPFTRVPGNIFNAVQEGTPLAFLDSRMRANLLGKNGAAARDTAIGRLAAGSAVMGMAALWQLQGKITGNGPIDPKQRAEWLLTHQPRSVQINGVWKSYDRFGPVGGWLALASDVTAASRALEAAMHDKTVTETDQKKYEQDLTEAYSRVVVGFTKWVEEAGYQGLFDMVEAMNDPKSTRASNIGRTAQTALPYSAFQSQIASFNDPYMRDLQTFVDGIKNGIPGQRETLPVRRDWSGAPRPNPSYHSMVKNREVNDDVVDTEMQRLDLKPTMPLPYIRGVRLSRNQYDEYLTNAGTLTRSMLHSFMNQPSWGSFPDYAKAQVIERTIASSRAQAQAYMQMKYPNLINEGVENRMRNILGQKQKPTAFPRPQ